MGFEYGELCYRRLCVTRRSVPRGRQAIATARKCTKALRRVNVGTVQTRDDVVTMSFFPQVGKIRRLFEFDDPAILGTEQLVSFVAQTDKNILIKPTKRTKFL